MTYDQVIANASARSSDCDSRPCPNSHRKVLGNLADSLTGQSCGTARQPIRPRRPGRGRSVRKQMKAAQETIEPPRQFRDGMQRNHGA